MHFAKLDENNKPIVEPITEKNLRALLNNVSLPDVLTPDSLVGTGYVCVRSGKEGEFFESNLTHICKLINYALDDENPGFYKPVYALRELLPEKIQLRIENQKNKLRQERTKKFQELDQLIARAMRESRMNLPLTISIERLDSYGKALSDITNQADVFNVTWPTL